MSKDLSTVLTWFGIESHDLGIEVTGLCLDSRKIKPGQIFIALNGTENHGIDFAYQAQRAGASAILAESVDNNKAKPKARQQALSITVIEIENLADKLGEAASQFYNQPSSKLKIVAITGTNGKTSSAWLMLQAWKELGIKGAYIGTLGFGTLDKMQEQPNTTPNALSLQKMLAEFVKQGITHVSLEASSHGLDLGRLNACQLVGSCFTNISRDHLDFHRTMEDYANTKKKLFTQHKSHFSIINSDDEYGSKWLKDLTNNPFSYSIRDGNADLRADGIQLTPKGIHFTLHWQNASYPVSTELLGHFNVENLLLVIGTLLQQGFLMEKIIPLISKLQPVPGRMNCVQVHKNSPLVIVDYAHTPDALKQVLLALKRHNARRIWCVFGCGGNRDKGKRPQMGHIAETLADKVIITDDNPRYEDNTAIAQDILMGMNTKPSVIHDRKAAIAYAITHAHPEDLILIAGKGHEPYQLINGQCIEFDDAAVAQGLLQQKMEECA